MAETTRRELVLHTMRGLGDVRVLIATRPGTDVTFYDDDDLNGEPGAYTGREALFIAGTAQNVGQTRYVTGSADRGIGFGVALPHATATGDECWLANTRGIGFRFQDARDAINRAIMAAREKGPISAAIDESTYAAGVDIGIPPGFVTIENVQWQDAQDATRWRVVKKALRIGGTGWWVDRSSRTVGIGGAPATAINGRVVRIWGLAEPALLYDDDDTTPVNAEWLISQAVGYLLEGRYIRTPTPETERTSFTLYQRAGGLRPLMVTRRGPFSESLG